MDLESGGIKAGGNVSTNRRLALEHRLSRENEDSIIAPVRDNLFDILACRGEIRPFCVPGQQFFRFGFGIELSLRTTIQSQSKQNQGQITGYLHKILCSHVNPFASKG